jgi:UDPglucose--hexose-1-phosphate uridylyltransferase
MKKTVTRLADGRELIYFDESDDAVHDLVDKRDLPEPPPGRAFATIRSWTTSVSQSAPASARSPSAPIFSRRNAASIAWSAPNVPSEPRRRWAMRDTMAFASATADADPQNTV